MPTTIAALQDRIIALIEAIVPTVLEGDRFDCFRDEDDADFVTQMASSPQGSLRKFQVIDTGARRPPESSNTDVEGAFVTLEILVAYPQTSRAGGGAARDRRSRMMDEDERLIGNAVGLHGYANFTEATPAPASWVDGSAARAESGGIDFLIIRQTMRYWRSRLP